GYNAPSSICSSWEGRCSIQRITASPCISLEASARRIKRSSVPRTTSRSEDPFMSRRPVYPKVLRIEPPTPGRATVTRRGTDPIVTTPELQNNRNPIRDGPGDHGKNFRDREKTDANKVDNRTYQKSVILGRETSWVRGTWGALDAFVSIAPTRHNSTGLHRCVV